jgi:8-oxo-dGTP diphosphatase
VTTLAVGAVILREGDGAVLLVRRAHAPAVGTWTLPGGKVEPGETVERAVVREVREETALDVTPVVVVEELELAREGFSYRIVDFLCRVTGGEARAGDDVDAVQWVRPADETTLALTPEVMRVIARARKMAYAAPS